MTAKEKEADQTPDQTPAKPQKGKLGLHAKMIASGESLGTPPAPASPASPAPASPAPALSPASVLPTPNEEPQRFKRPRNVARIIRPRGAQQFNHNVSDEARWAVDDFLNSLKREGTPYYAYELLDVLLINLKRPDFAQQVREMLQNTPVGQE